MALGNFKWNQGLFTKANLSKVTFMAKENYFIQMYDDNNFRVAIIRLNGNKVKWSQENTSSRIIFDTNNPRNGNTVLDKIEDSMKNT